MAFLSKIKRVVKLQTGEQSPRSNTQSMDSLGAAASDSQLSSTSENSRTAIYEDLLVGGDIILDVIYSTRENVHIVHEVFRQVPFKRVGIKRGYGCGYGWRIRMRMRKYG